MELMDEWMDGWFAGFNICVDDENIIYTKSNDGLPFHHRLNLFSITFHYYFITNYY